MLLRLIFRLTHFENFWLATPETILARTVWTYLEK